MTYVLRASSLGSCIKAQAALLQGHKALPTPEKVQGWYDAGNEHETANEAALVEQGWRITGQQQEVILSFDGARIEGHLDGIIHGGVSDTPLGTHVWESKSPGAWAKFEKAYKTGDWSDPLAHRYGYQAAVYMLAKGMEMMVTCLDGDTVRSFVIEVPPFTLPEVEQRVGEILVFAAGELPALCSQSDWPCPVAYLHEDEEVDEDPDMDRAVADYLSAGTMIKEWKAKQDRAKKKVEEVLGDREQVKTGASTVTRYEQAAPKKYDMDLIRQFMAKRDYDLDEYLIEGKPSTRVKITPRGADVEAE